ncbi:MAG: protein kinase [Verrucomicrobiota bacterium]
MKTMQDDSKSPPPTQPPAPATGNEAAIFEAAVELPPERRATFVEKACAGNASLRDRVQRLLKAHTDAGNFLESPQPKLAGPTGTQLVAPLPTEKPGDVIGRYKIRETLGEGGCGVVYVAEQTEPVRRRVALKIIKLGMDTRNVIARFEAERQALALMDHPNIAKVLDAGATAAGRPFFVMELVRGIRITDYCDQNKLSTRERLQLFIQVCNAIQHAHQKGIIHRDIKPSNILVTLHDGVPVPKVIDFGIAKATEGRLTDLTIYTELHQFIGTPAYMSPEQAEMSGLDIDTRSDIYSLGVLLYELLTGRTPFDGRELVQSGLDQMRRTLRESDPPRPSNRLSTMQNADLTDVARRHGAEAPRLVHFVQGDLDWIVMRALEKDRTRRYETSNELALDVRRFLNDEPVEACPPSNWYRLQKLVRRNRGVFIAAALVSTCLILGLVALTHLYIQENKAYKRAVAAEQEQARLRIEAEKGLEAERMLRSLAPLREQFTAVGMLLSKGQVEKAEEGMSGAPLIPETALMYASIAQVYARMGRYPAAITNYHRALAASPTNPATFFCLAPLLVQAGDNDAYSDLRRRMIGQFAGTADPDLAAELAAASLFTPPGTNELGSIQQWMERFPQPQTVNQTLARALLDVRLGRFAEAQRFLEIAPLANPVAEVARLSLLSMAQRGLGNVAGAQASAQQAQALAAAKLSNTADPDWNLFLAARLLAREAEAGLHHPAAP